MPNKVPRSRLRGAVNSPACQGDGVGSLKSWQDDEGGLRRETTVPPSAEIEAQIEQLLAVGVGENPRESLSELAGSGPG